MAQHEDKAHEATARKAGDPDARIAPQGPQFATFKLVYESRDGKLCLFEDADGHLTAVNAARLA